jgi:DNA processing protein
MIESHELRCRVWLALADGVSLRARRLLLTRYGSYAALYDAFPGDAGKVLTPRLMEELARLKTAGLERLVDRLDALGIRVAFLNASQEYPALLAQIADPPDLLFYKGMLQADEGRAMAIVGSRRETRYGRTNAHAIARGLAAEGVTIVSGLARGIDTAAHKGALAAGGRTIAVLGSGHSCLYPQENAALAEQIVQSGGAVISELPPNTQPLAYHFPVRNRIVSGLSHGVLLVEAREKSGTLITVGHALDQGREVFALPGEVDAPGSQIPHRMIREGARLCTSAADILEDMGWRSAHPEQEGTQQQMDLSHSPQPEGEAGAIRQVLADEERSFEELLAATGLSTADLNTHLTLLELDGWVESLPGRSYRLKRRN